MANSSGGNDVIAQLTTRTIRQQLDDVLVIEQKNAPEATRIPAVFKTLRRVRQKVTDDKIDKDVGEPLLKMKDEQSAEQLEVYTHQFLFLLAGSNKWDKIVDKWRSADHLQSIQDLDSKITIDQILRRCECDKNRYEAGKPNETVLGEAARVADIADKILVQFTTLGLAIKRVAVSPASQNVATVLSSAPMVGVTFAALSPILNACHTAGQIPKKAHGCLERVERLIDYLNEVTAIDDKRDESFTIIMELLVGQIQQVNVIFLERRGKLKLMKRPWKASGHSDALDEMNTRIDQVLNERSTVDVMKHSKHLEKLQMQNAEMRETADYVAKDVKRIPSLLLAVALFVICAWFAFAQQSKQHHQDNISSIEEGMVEVRHAVSDRIAEIQIGVTGLSSDVNTIGEKVDAIHPQMMLPQSMLAERPKCFGRTKELGKLHEILSSPRTMASLVGGAGMGKSRIAEAFACDWTEEDPSNRFGFRFFAETETRLRVDYLTAWDRLGIQSEKEPKKLSISELASGIWFALGKLPPTMEWIMVFDNVPEARDGLEGPVAFQPWFFPTPLKAWGRGRIVFTTRSTGYGGNTVLGHITKMNINPLEESIAVEMLLADTIDGVEGTVLEESERAAAEILVSRSFFDGLPLAIATASAQIIDTGTSVEGYLDDIKAGMEDGVRDAVTVALAKALAHARQSGLGSVLDIAAFVSPDRIPIQLLLNNKEATQRLYKMSLLRRIEKNVYSMHRLHQAAARVDCSPEAAVRATKGGLSTFKYSDSSTWKSGIAMLPHVEALMTNLKDIGFISSLSNDNEVLLGYCSILGWSGRMFHEMHDFEQAHAKYEEALDIQRHVYGANAKNADIANTLDSLGSQYNKLGQYEEARDKYDEALNMKRHVYGENDKNSDIASTLTNLGSLYINLGRYEEARGKYEEALDMQRHVYGANDKNVGIATTLHNLGMLYSKVGQYEKARKKYEEALAMQRHVYGANAKSFSIARTLVGLGLMYGIRGHYEEARGLFEEAMKMVTESLGSNAVTHPLYATIQKYLLTTIQLIEAGDVYDGFT